MRRIIQLCPGGASAWTPATLGSDLVLHLRPEELEASFSDTDQIDTWTAAAGQNKTQSNSTKRPLFDADALNSRGGAVFDGSDDFLESAAAFDLNHSFSYALVAIANDAGIVIEMSPDAFNNDGFWIYSQTGDTLFVNDGSNKNGVNHPDGANWWDGSPEYKILVVTWSGTNGGWTIKENGVDVTPVASGSSDNTSGTINDKMYVGGRDTGSLFPSCTIVELFLVNRQLSAAERTSASDYLNDRFAVY